MKFYEMPWPELAKVDREQTLILAPVGACEQHGPHLPTFTDSLTAAAIAEGIEAQLPGRVLLLPVMWLGASEHHLPFGATLTARVETHITLLTELVRPLLADGYRRLFFLNAHGGNIDTINVTLRRLQQEYPEVLLTAAGYWDLAEKEIAAICESPQTSPLHACEVETSIILALRPDLVRDVKLVDYDEPADDALRGLHITRDMAQSTRDGHVGYPSYGTAEKGEQFLKVIIGCAAKICGAILQTPLPVTRTPAKEMQTP